MSHCKDIKVGDNVVLSKSKLWPEWVGHSLTVTAIAPGGLHCVTDSDYKVFVNWCEVADDL